MDFMDLIEIPKVESVIFQYQQYSEPDNVVKSVIIEGSICLTSHHLLFIPRDSTKNKEIWILHSLIDSIELKIRETKFQLIIKCKNFRIYTIDFGNIYQCQAVYKSLDSLSNITSDNMKVPFFSQLKFKKREADWNLYSIDDELNKCIADAVTGSCDWRISEVNLNYAVCATYPTRSIVPKNIDDATLIKSSQFRAHGRFPLLSYYHKKDKTFLMRSSQPLLGSSSRRCKEDELLLKSVLPIGKKGYIYDLRDAGVLKSATSKGGGYETDASYPLWKRINKHLDRYDQLQQSFVKVIDACMSDPMQYVAKLESSNWMLNIRQAIYVAGLIADEVHNKNACVLVHGWDGWDNTLLVCSLVRVILDPECRTLRGFIGLVEREWLQAGHPFSRRCCKSAYGSSSQKTEGPVFLLFLDCIRQFIDQFCLSFEFNEEFLILLFDNSYASEYGTFLGNCAKEREQLQINKRTDSLWSYVLADENIKTYLNPLYRPNEAALWPSVYAQSMNVWTGLFMRNLINENPQKEAYNQTIKMIEANKQAYLKFEKLQKEMAQLEKEATELGITINDEENTN